MSRIKVCYKLSARSTCYRHFHIHCHLPTGAWLSGTCMQPLKTLNTPTWLWSFSPRVYARLDLHTSVQYPKATHNNMWAGLSVYLHTFSCFSALLTPWSWRLSLLDLLVHVVVFPETNSDSGRLPPVTGVVSFTSIIIQRFKHKVVEYPTQYLLPSPASHKKISI